MTIERKTTILDIPVPFSTRMLQSGSVRRNPNESWTLSSIKGLFSPEELDLLGASAGNDRMRVGGVTVEDPDTVSFSFINPGSSVVQFDPPVTVRREQINTAGFETVPTSAFEITHKLVWTPSRSRRR